jgi:hypothetical protein
MNTSHVIATSVEGTEAALRAAQPLVRRQEARVVLPVVDSSPSTARGTAFATNWLVARYEALASRIGHHVQFRLCKAPGIAEAARRLIPLQAQIYIGGPSTWFWPSAEERLAARLRRAGRHVVFVGGNGRKPARSEEVHVHA